MSYMRPFRLAELENAFAKAKILSRVLEKFEGVGTDTRKNLSGQIFIALVGESFDAHNFLENAVNAGASALVVHKTTEQNSNVIEKLKSRVTVIEVPDTLIALQELGRYCRRNSKAKILGITGSNGKTSTKEFAAAIIGSHREVHYSKGSFNNHWGVPFTLIECPPSAEVAVVEMGMNHAGEITRLCEIAEPDAVVCTMVGRAHIEFFGTVEKIAEAKEEIYLASPAPAIRIFNLDDVNVEKMYRRHLASRPTPSESQSPQVITFSSRVVTADVCVEIAEVNMSSLKLVGAIRGVKGAVEVPVFGVHNITNILAAVGLALAAGLAPQEIWSALPKCRSTWGRNQFVKLSSGAEMIFDGYNANPDSMKALLENMRLVKNSGLKIGVFGQMREMGEHAQSFHKELGELVASIGFSDVYFVGEDVESFRAGLTNKKFSGKMHLRPDYSDELAQQLRSNLKAGDVAVVKGSRGMKLERFVVACDPLEFDLKKD